MRQGAAEQVELPDDQAVAGSDKGEGLGDAGYEIHWRINEADRVSKRLFDVIESGLVDKDDAVAKERMAGLKALRDQAMGDAERIAAAVGSESSQPVSSDMLQAFAHNARERMRVEVAGDEVRIMESQMERLQLCLPLRACDLRRSAFIVLF